MTLNQYLRRMLKLNRAISLNKLKGELLGSGIHRDVYVCKLDPKYVVKIERNMAMANWANVTEYKNWENNKDWKAISKYMAPCLFITQNGAILFQRRVRFYKDRKYPAQIPQMFTDLKKTNFGWIGKQLICCDYSFLLSSSACAKLKKAKWWNESGYAMDLEERAETDRKLKRTKSK